MAGGSKLCDDATVVKVGPKLRQLRLLKGITMQELAELVGCSESMISKIETNKSNPSFPTLQRIIQVLDTNVAYLFAVDSAIETPVSQAGSRPVVSFDHVGRGTGIKMERLIPYSSDHLLQANIHIVEPGGGTHAPICHVGEEVGYVLEGEVELTIGEDTFNLKAGDSFHFRSELPHGYRETGKRRARIIWINTPPSYYMRPSQSLPKVGTRRKAKRKTRGSH